MRPRLGDRKRSIVMGIKVTPVMRERIEAQALYEGLTMSTFIVKVLADYLKMCNSPSTEGENK